MLAVWISDGADVFVVFLSLSSQNPGLCLQLGKDNFVQSLSISVQSSTVTDIGVVVKYIIKCKHDVPGVAYAPIKLLVFRRIRKIVTSDY
jgi:hypothetical protein